MPTFAAFLAALGENVRGKGKIHASLQQGAGFVFSPPPPTPSQSVPTQQIVIESSSICSVSYGGRM